MRKIFAVLLVLLMLTVAVSAQDDTTPDMTTTDDTIPDDTTPDDTTPDDTIPKEEPTEMDLYEQEFEELAEEDIYEGIGDVELQGRAGVTPDSPLYIVETFIENIIVGNNPKRALDHKQQKMLEVKEMIEEGNLEAAEKAMERADKYNEILQREVTPELEVQVRESSKATKEMFESLESELEGDEWGDFRERVDENLKTEDRIALAAKVSSKIKELCEVLSDLDPLQYAQVCKTGDDAPKWKKNLDKKLTKEQEREAKKFFGIMSECFENPRECRCDDISIKPFAEKCNIIAPLAAACEEGDEEACEQMDGAGDPIDLLPDYLQGVMRNLEDDYGDAKHDMHLPKECAEVGATSREACMKVMFRLDAPPECTEALERGEIDPKNEREAREACEKIMWDLEAPDECKEAGLTDHRECERYMFRLEAPQECLDAGLTGSGRDDWKKCELIRFKLEAPEACIEAGITGENRDDWKKCELIQFQLDAPQECLDAGITGENRDDWKKCDAIKFQLEAHPDCLEAGLDGTGRDDWKRCQVIQFKAEAPQACLDAGLTGAGRDDWRKCDAINFREEAHPDCLAAGLTGEGRDDWRKCQVIQFKAEAPPECLAAGLDGSGRDDWRECERIREQTEDRHRDEDRRIDPGDDDWDRGDDGGGDWDRGDDDVAGCHDCAAQCPGASRTDCVNDQCECYYDDKPGDDDIGGDDAPPGDDDTTTTPDDTTKDDTTTDDTTTPEAGGGGGDGDDDASSGGGGGDGDDDASSGGGGEVVE